MIYDARSSSAATGNRIMVANNNNNNNNKLVINSIRVREQKMFPGITGADLLIWIFQTFMQSVRAMKV